MYEVLLTIQFMSVVVLLIESLYVFTNWNTKLQGGLFFLCISNLINNVGYYLEMKSTSEAAYISALKASYLGRAFTGFSLLVFVLYICRIRYSKKLLVALTFYHSLIFFFVLTQEYQGFYYKSSEYIKGELFNYIEFQHGPVYQFNTIVLVFYIIYGLSNLYISLLKEKNKTTKARLAMVTAAITFYCLVYFVNMFNVAKGYDITFLGSAVMAVTLCIAIFKYGLLDTLQLAKDYVFDEISEGIVVVDEKGKLQYCNEPAKTIFSELEKNITSVKDMIDESINANAPFKIGERIYKATAKALNHQGDTAGIAYVISDITDQYHFVKDLQEQKDIAEAANESKSRFLSIVSHEIRTPMNAVVGMTDLLLRDEESLSQKQKKYLNNIKNSGAALVMLVNDILDQSKIEAGKMEIVDEPYELMPLLDDIKMIIENRIGTKPISLLLEVDEKIDSNLIGDSLRIRQILINLLNNAVKFTEEGFIKLSIICVEKTKEQYKVKFSIKDSGQGIKPEDLLVLGEAFKQVDTKKNHKKEGTGLGISISKDFIQMMGGMLEVESEYGQGTEFFFTIPQGIAKDTDLNTDDIVKKHAWQEVGDFTTPDAKVLVVDDTEINLMIVEEMLMPLKIQVDTVSKGEDAIEAIKNQTYHLVLMDYMMPYMDGVETTKAIRELGYEVPIIALTSDNSEETKEKFESAGINDFTEKPLELDRVKKLLLKWLPEELIVG